MKRISYIFITFLIPFLGWAQSTTKIKNHPEVEVKNMEVLNSTAYDFSPVRYGNGVFITSDRGGAEKYNPESNRFGKCKCRCEDERAIQASCTDLFYAEKEGDNYKTPVPVKGAINFNYHDGVVTFSPDKNTMYFTRNNTYAKNKLNLKLYKAEKDGDRWGMIKELPFNSDTFNTAHPTLSADGKRLYFSSDRPGTNGGMDLWVVQLNNGEWGNPMNLGTTINTDKNEIFPYISDDNMLYFASNGHAGLGGLDNFSAKQLTAGDEASWGKVTNLGTPFNSEADDLCFNTVAGEKEGFFVSGRSGGQGGDDIYSFKWDKKKARIEKKILVYDAKTGQPLEEVRVSVNGNHGNDAPETRAYLSDNKGIIIHTVVPEGSYTYDLKKFGYIPKNITVPAEELLTDEDVVYKIPLEKAPTMPFEGVVKNRDNGEPIPGASVKIINKLNGKVTTVLAGPDGKFNFDMECDTDYDIITNKDGFEEEKTYIAAVPCDKVAPQKKEILMKPAYYVGQVITLKNIYYNFDKYNIRKDAAIELDYVVNLLQTYPSMELELSSHTDCRGSFKYNDKLSTRRAKSAVDYILKKGGFSASRLVAAGYGEHQLINRCKDGVRCSEVEHQLNRRTEIKITKFNEVGVGVDPAVRKN